MIRKSLFGDNFCDSIDNFCYSIDNSPDSIDNFAYLIDKFPDSIDNEKPSARPRYLLECQPAIR